MAPEQVAQTEIDHRADIFALGCILYEATVGRCAFDGPSAIVKPGSVSARQLKPPRAIIASYPADLEAIVLKALAHDRQKRYQTAEELGVALGAWLARARGVVTEQAIAQLMADATGQLIEEKARRIQDAMRRFPAPIPLIDTLSGAGPAAPGLERPTLPAGPAARKTRHGTV
jgi:serine/threonine-protein kinase